MKLRLLLGTLGTFGLYVPYGQAVTTLCILSSLMLCPRHTCLPLFHTLLIHLTPLNSAMSKKEVSRKEYSMLEEWAPQTLNAYHCAESPTATLAGPNEALTTPERNPSRRRRTRSSSIYEEWKSQALQSDGIVKPATAPPQGETKQGLVNKTSVLRGPGGVESVKGRHQRPAEAGVSTGT